MGHEQRQRHVSEQRATDASQYYFTDPGAAVGAKDDQIGSHGQGMVADDLCHRFACRIDAFEIDHNVMASQIVSHVRSGLLTMPFSFARGVDDQQIDAIAAWFAAQPE